MVTLLHKIDRGVYCKIKLEENGINKTYLYKKLIMVATTWWEIYGGYDTPQIEVYGDYKKLG